MYNNVFLAKVVSFDSVSLIFNDDEIEIPFQSEEYRLIVAFDDWAYDLVDEGKRYHIIDMTNYVIPDEEIETLLPNVKYVYDMYPFEDIWESISIVFQIDEDMKNYLDPKIDFAKQLHESLSNSIKTGRVIDFETAKRFIKERKF